jgi:hypothetical protein
MKKVHVLSDLIGRANTLELVCIAILHRETADLSGGALSRPARNSAGTSG